ncbi:MAG TPA: tRNA uridine-5-carboxymethylaminomethyl(34) synthesis GTPase MnmE [Thermoanaerobaculia bacterium]|jgi:tRNA modification GTPase
MRTATESFLDTIVAPATPPGRSALAVIRISGPHAGDVLRALAPRLPEPPAPRRATLAAIVDDAGDAIDRGLVTFFPGAASFTGEDVAEISVHGAPVVIARVLEAARAAGARLARPGEFTERAFWNGKIDLVRAEAIAELIEARTPAAARASLGRLEGGLSRRFAAAREDLFSAAAGLAAAIDFAEDVGEAVPEGARAALGRAEAELGRLLETYRTGRLLAAGCRVAILGPPNAGKSTLFNVLAGSERAIVTDVPGTTRDALEATVDVGGVPVTVVDTAGLRETDDVVERIGVARAREEAARADLVLYVYEAAAEPDEEGRRALACLDRQGRPVRRVANKLDHATPSQAAAARAEADLALCGLEAAAAEKLRAFLAAEITTRLDAEAGGDLLSSVRQRDLAVRARESSAEARASLARGESPEYAASHVGAALEAFADLFGETTADDVLNRIFATFCIGK